MFTGIVEETGKIEKVEKKASLWKLGVFSRIVYEKAKISDSISVNGVCLTVTEKKDNLLFFEVVRPTVETTNLKRIYPGSIVNLESALNVGDKLGGHFVLGHVDCESKIKRVTRQGDFWVFDIESSSEYRKVLVKKGSIAVDGISLTVYDVKNAYFSINIIPHTYANTALKGKKAGTWVNLEYDYLLKSVNVKGN